MDQVLDLILKRWKRWHAGRW